MTPRASAAQVDTHDPSEDRDAGQSFRVYGPKPGSAPSPLLFASPHSGRIYPEGLRQASRLSDLDLSRSEDALVDRLLEAAPDLGVTVIAARFARVYVDVNREPWELDPAMFRDPLPAFVERRSPRVAAGLGVIARTVGDGREIYRRPLGFAEAAERVMRVHTPYHAELSRLIERTRSDLGLAVLIDWHSMPSAAAKYGPGPGRDVVLGDRFGRACAPGLTARLEAGFSALGYDVARNFPYSGGYTTETYGRPETGVHAIQIELNRALYLDEVARRPTAGFARLQADLERLITALVDVEWSSI
jgi:N-formylglutamate amidohydrolase